MEATHFVVISDDDDHDDVHVVDRYVHVDTTDRKGKSIPLLLSVYLSKFNTHVNQICPRSRATMCCNKRNLF